MNCPDHQKLAQLLAATLSEDDQAWVHEHINECTSCQARLEAMIGGRPMNEPETLTSPAVAHERDPVLQKVLSKMRGKPPEFYIEERNKGGDAPTTVVFPGDPTPEAPLGKLDRYHILERLGIGATGHIFKAQDPQLNREVAIKTLRQALSQSESARARFDQEARSAAKLDHENIISIYEVASPDNFPPYMVMELVEGDSLRDRLVPDRPFDAREAVEIIRQVALGLQAAHDAGVIHRDIKPSNILLAEPHDRAMIADFGLAREVRGKGGLTVEGVVAGTPAYMSPEQIAHFKTADRRSDIYSLGVILYELLTGQRPFRGVMRMVLTQVLNDEPPRPRELNDSIPLDLERICVKCIAKQPSGRYQSGKELADELTRWLEGKPVSARPIGVFGVAWKRLRRNPMTVLPYVVAVTAICVAIYLKQAPSNSSPGNSSTLSHQDENSGFAGHVAHKVLGETLVGSGDSAETVEVKASVLQVLVNELSQHDERHLLRAESLNQLGELRLLLEDRDAAKACFVQTVNLIEQSGDESRQWAMVSAHGNWRLGEFQFEDGDHESAANSFKRAVVQAQSIVKTADDKASVIRILAGASERLGALAQASDQPDMASEQWKRALQSVSAIAADASAEDWQVRRKLAGLCVKLGEINRTTNAPAASEYFRQAHDYFLEIKKVRPGKLDSERDVAHSFLRLGILHQSDGDSVSALENVLRSRFLLRKLSEDHTEPYLQVLLARSEFWLGIIYKSEKRDVEAKQQFEAALTIIQSFSTNKLEEDENLAASVADLKKLVNAEMSSGNSE
ncbi:MAG: hypothetical protein CMJ78_21965 [Planctomycetaceae bacterium]|nr:hypothetical protein [Planctomycetaceae bacterium]